MVGARSHPPRTALFTFTAQGEMKCGNHQAGEHYLLLETESLGGARARPLTPAVREGSEFALLFWAPSLPQVLGFRLARKEDFGD